MIIETKEKIFYTAKNDKVFKTILGNEDKKELRKYYVMDDDGIKFINNFEIWEYNMDKAIA